MARASSSGLNLDCESSSRGSETSVWMDLDNLVRLQSNESSSEKDRSLDWNDGCSNNVSMSSSMCRTSDMPNSF